MYNLNHPEVRRRFSRAVSLGGYLHFIDRVKELKGGKMLTEEMIDRAINECIEQGILAEFFREHRKEIKNTMIIDETYENRLRLERLENERERADRPSRPPPPHNHGAAGATPPPPPPPPQTKPAPRPYP